MKALVYALSLIPGSKQQQIAAVATVPAVAHAATHKHKAHAHKASTHHKVSKKSHAKA